MNMTSLQKQAKPTPLQAFKDERIPLSEIHLTQGDYKFLYFFYRDLNNREPQLGVCLIPYSIYIWATRLVTHRKHTDDVSGHECRTGYSHYTIQGDHLQDREKHPLVLRQGRKNSNETWKEIIFKQSAWILSLLHSFGSLAKTCGLSNTIRRIFGSPVKYDTMSVEGAPVFHPTDAKCHD